MHIRSQVEGPWDRPTKGGHHHGQTSDEKEEEEKWKKEI
jgi:hypothetical protein